MLGKLALVYDAGGGKHRRVFHLRRHHRLPSAQAAAAVAGGTKYDLVASIVHDLPPDTSERRSGASADPIATGSYRVHVMHEAAGTWYELQVRSMRGEGCPPVFTPSFLPPHLGDAQDLHVQETLPQLIGLTEAYILVYKRHGLPPPPVAFTPDGRPREA